MPNLQDELRELKIPALRARAADEGIDNARIEAARDDEDDAKGALIALILEKASALDVAALRAMKKPELRAKAAELGVPEEEIEAARDEDDEKEAVLRLSMAMFLFFFEM